MVRSVRRGVYTCACLAVIALAAGFTAGRPIRVNPTVAGKHSTIPGHRDPAPPQHRPPVQSDGKYPHVKAGGSGGGHMWGSAAAATGCPETDVLAVTFESSPSSDDGKLYGNLMAYGLLQIKPGDYFEYEYMYVYALFICTL